ncbi:MAG: hypothetical protein J6A95_06645 [Clostridia bacterium]|nr:hypothetical protein [Clostridia bacterium]
MKKKKYILAVIAIIMCLIFSLMGCGYQAGDFSYEYSSMQLGAPPMVGIKAKTNKFSLDNVTFDLYYGFYDMNSERKPREQYGNNVDVFFAVYACEASSDHLYPKGDEIEDYRELEKHYFIKSIEDEQAFTEEYGYTFDIAGASYNHSEPITVPKEVFKEQKGEFKIKLITFKQLFSHSKHKIYDYENIYLGYEIIEGNKVKIDFSSLLN